MPNSKDGLLRILSKLSDDALFALEGTVTQHLKKSETVEEAVESIMKHSPDFVSVLRRKLITKEVLFSYLEDINIFVKLPMSKNELIDNIANAWNIPQASYFQEEDSESVTKFKGKPVQLMAEQFATWFYLLINNNECGSENFFPDAVLKVNMYSGDYCQTTLVENDAEEIANTLSKIRTEHNLYFNHNESQEGIQGKINPHGLVMVLTCGTLHAQHVCFGVFEQVFTLARDPCSENNWKVKKSEINIRAKNNVLGQPKLCDSILVDEVDLVS